MDLGSPLDKPRFLCVVMFIKKGQSILVEALPSDIIGSRSSVSLLVEVCEIDRMEIDPNLMDSLLIFSGTCCDLPWKVGCSKPFPISLTDFSLRFQDLCSYNPAYRSF